MRTSTLRRSVLLAAAAGTFALPTAPSDPIGAYAVVDRVVITPAGPSTPETVQIWGTFAISDRKPGDNYQPPLKGYLYYRINPENEAGSRAEWSDLQTVAGKKMVVGFSTKYAKVSAPRVRCAGDAPVDPDVYALGIGVVRTQNTRHTGWTIAAGLLGGSASEAPCRARR